MYRSPTATWSAIDTRTWVTTADPMDERPQKDLTAVHPPPGTETGPWVVQDQVVFDSVAYHLIISGGTGSLRVFVRDAQGFEGTVDVTCEPLDEKDWLVTLDDTAVNRMNGQLRTIASLNYPLYICFCRSAF